MGIKFAYKSGTNSRMVSFIENPFFSIRSEEERQARRANKKLIINDNRSWEVDYSCSLFFAVLWPRCIRGSGKSRASWMSKTSNRALLHLRPAAFRNPSAVEMNTSTFTTLRLLPDWLHQTYPLNQASHNRRPLPEYKLWLTSNFTPNDTPHSSSSRSGWDHPILKEFVICLKLTLIVWWVEWLPPTARPCEANANVWAKTNPQRQVRNAPVSCTIRL